LQIQNTSKDPHKLLFRKFTATRNREGSLRKSSVQLKQKELRETAVAISEGVGVDLSSSNQRCILCLKKLVINCTIEEEAALVNESNLKSRQRVGIRRFLNAKSVDIFPPYRALQAHFQTLQTVDYETSLVELFKFKQYDSNAVAEKISVPLLSLRNMKIALIRWIIEADREKSYLRHPWQNVGELMWLLGGDMGAETTKFLAVLTHQQKFNSGSLMRLLVMFKKAADNYPNLHNYRT
jgi:hypothetical protein